MKRGMLTDAEGEVASATKPHADQRRWAEGVAAAQPVLQQHIAAKYQAQQLVVS